MGLTFVLRVGRNHVCGISHDCRRRPSPADGSGVADQRQDGVPAGKGRQARPIVLHPSCRRALGTRTRYDKLAANFLSGGGLVTALAFYE